MQSGNLRFQPSTRFEPRTAYAAPTSHTKRRRNRAFMRCIAGEPTVDLKRYPVKALHHRPLSVESVQKCLLGLNREFLSIKADEGVRKRLGRALFPSSTR
jgi:hypothetical protein